VFEPSTSCFAPCGWRGGAPVRGGRGLVRGDAAAVDGVLRGQVADGGRELVRFEVLHAEREAGVRFEGGR
jgi:hypothetical protein